MHRPASIDIDYVRGDSRPIEFVVADEKGAAVDITGWTFELTVDPSPSPPDANTLLMQIAGTIVSGPDGTVQFSPTIAQSDFAPGRHFYDVQAIDAAGAKSTIVTGAFTLHQDVTKT